MAISWVRSHASNAATGGATTITLAPAATIPVNNHLLLGIMCNTASASVTSVTDTQSNTYQIDRSHNATIRFVAIVSAKITTQLTTGDTITVTYGASSSNRIVTAEEFTGMHLTTWLDAGKVNSGTGTSTTPDSGNVTTTTAGSLLWGAFNAGSAAAAYAPGTTNAGAYAYTEGVERQAGAANIGETEYYVGAGAGVTVSANGTITSTAWTQVLAVYLPAAGAAATAGLFPVF